MAMVTYAAKYISVDTLRDVINQLYAYRDNAVDFEAEARVRPDDFMTWPGADYFGRQQALQQAIDLLIPLTRAD